jgi:hypothetical protein
MEIIHKDLENLNPASVKSEGYERQGYILAWDIPSEGFSFLKTSDKDLPEQKTIKKTAFTKVTAVRIKSGNRFHSIGLPATNSVILIPHSTSDETVDNIISQTEKDYTQLNELLATWGLPSVGKPDIHKIAIVKFQFTKFRDMAEKNLRDKLDQQLDNLAHKINELSQLEDNKKKSFASRYKQEKREIDEIRDLAKRLDINVDDKFELLEALVSKAISVVS